MSEVPHRRRPRYSGKNPRRFEDKYKELAPEKYPETIEKVLASGKTPAGTHVPVMVAEILEVLRPQPGESCVDCTLGHGGHASALLPLLQPGGRLLGIDADPLELPKTEARLRQLGFGPDAFLAYRSNYAGLPRAMEAAGMMGADCLLSDLGVSSMQLDAPDRGFSTKIPGPNDMRMNPRKGIPASRLLKKLSAEKLAWILRENSDEPHTDRISAALAGRDLPLTTDLAAAVRVCLAHLPPDDVEKSVRRVFQALRIEVNEEFHALETLLRFLPSCLNPGGRIAILTFHSGEDRRVKNAFRAGHRAGVYSMVSREVVRPAPSECRANPRSSSAKLRWAIRAAG